MVRNAVRPTPSHVWYTSQDVPLPAAADAAFAKQGFNHIDLGLSDTTKNAGMDRCT